MNKSLDVVLFLTTIKTRYRRALQAADIGTWQGEPTRVMACALKLRVMWMNWCQENAGVGAPMQLKHDDGVDRKTA